MAAIVATRDDNMLAELFSHLGDFDLSFFSNSTASQFVRHFVLKGTLQDMEVLQKRLRMLLGDLTFLEAFNLSGEAHIPRGSSPFTHLPCSYIAFLGVTVNVADMRQPS